MKNRPLLNILGFCLVVIVSCKFKDEKADVYNYKYYKRVSSIEDSAYNMYVVYRSVLDTNRFLLKYYWDNGRLQAKGFFYKKLKDGIWEQYHLNGNLSFRGKYELDQPVGKHLTYGDDGKFKREKVFKK